MSAMGTYLRNAVLDAVFKDGADVAAIESVFISLHLSAGATSASADWLATEVDGTNYARVEFVPADWGTITDGEIESAEDCTFPIAGEDWGEVTHAAVWDAATSGNLLFKGPFSTPRTVYNGDSASFATGNLVVHVK